MPLQPLECQMREEGTISSMTVPEKRSQSFFLARSAQQLFRADQTKHARINCFVEARCAKIPSLPLQSGIDRSSLGGAQTQPTAPRPVRHQSNHELRFPPVRSS